MYGNIIFIGGIHGVGKSTICKVVTDMLEIEYLSASQVLKWREIKTDYKDKKVEDIDYTQDKLIIGLNEIVVSDKFYLLDGHFCLFNNLGEINRVPLETFTSIKPILICTIIGNPNEIARKLSSRDHKQYDPNRLLLMQEEEKSYGDSVAKYLQVNYLEISLEQSSILVQTIQTLIE